MKAPKPMIVSGVLAAVAILAGSLAVSPRTAWAEMDFEGGDRCSGRVQPVCREVEKCVGIQGSKVCITDSFYFSDESAQ